MDKDIRIKFASHLRKLRKKAGWTQEKLAEKTSLAPRHIQRLENLKNPPPVKIDTLAKLAKAFGVRPSKLLEF